MLLFLLLASQTNSIVNHSIRKRERRMVGKYRVAAICASNQNRSMEAHNVLKYVDIISLSVHSLLVEKQAIMSLLMERGVWSDYLVRQSINRISITSEHPTIPSIRN